MKIGTRVKIKPKTHSLHCVFYFSKSVFGTVTQGLIDDNSVYVRFDNEVKLKGEVTVICASFNIKDLEVLG